MPLKGSKKKRFSEFRHGSRYKKVAKRHGKAKANKMMQAAVLSSMRRRKKRRK